MANIDPRTQGEDQDAGIASAREPRLKRLVKVQISSDNCPRPQKAIVRNISSHGLCAKSAMRVQRGERITICKSGFGTVEATVRWVRSGEFGVLFDDQIDVDLFNFGSANHEGHFVKKIDNAHVWKGFQRAASTKRPGFGPRYKG